MVMIQLLLSIFPIIVGEFGQVYKAYLKRSFGTDLVAVKTLKRKH